MKIHLESTFGPLNFKGTNERGQSLQMSGDKESVSPMEAVLMAVAGCSSIDIELILKKMRQDLHKIEVEVDSLRADEDPKVFTKIKIHYILHGNIKEEKAKQAIDLSMEKYCSVSIMLKKSVEIKYSFEIRPISWDASL
ncbi:MAG: OsmC family protein [Saprospiraceae bacterium]|nr:OsmC family protein [Saprospiraceae bacterium]MBK8819494.1 OsmC family protein [Saprospiraceae bacterium]MBK9042016.1 OsmC family protein [Saprospiraceae bacterium]